MIGLGPNPEVQVVHRGRAPNTVPFSALEASFTHKLQPEYFSVQTVHTITHVILSPVGQPAPTSTSAMAVFGLFAPPLSLLSSPTHVGSLLPTSFSCITRSCHQEQVLVMQTFQTTSDPAPPLPSPDFDNSALASKVSIGALIIGIGTL